MARLNAKAQKQYKQRESEIQDLVCAYKAEDANFLQKTRIEADLYERFSILAAYIARKYKNNPLTEERMAAAGMEGFAKALIKYDPFKEDALPFYGYAARGMNSHVLEEIQNHFGFVSAWSKHLFAHENTYRKESKARFPDMKDEDLDIVIAKAYMEGAKGKSFNVTSLEMAQKHLEIYREKLINGRKTFSLNSMLSEDKGGKERIDDLVDEEALSTEDSYAAQDESRVLREIFVEAFSRLDEREKKIFAGRLPVMASESSDIPSKTLEDLSQEMGVSRERVRQLNVKAVEKVKKEIQKLARLKGFNVIAGVNLTVSPETEAACSVRKGRPDKVDVCAIDYELT